MNSLVKAIANACLATALAATPALAATNNNNNSSSRTSGFWANPYIGLSGDATWTPHSKTGGGGNVAIGGQIWPGSFGDVRLEAEFGYHGVPSRSGSDGNNHYFTYMANAYVDLSTIRPWSGSNSWQIVPYLGAGVGDATVHFGENRGFRSGFNNGFGSFHDNENAFAYQFMAGLTTVMPTMPNTDWSIGYRYTGSARVSGSHLNANSAELGLRFHF